MKSFTLIETVVAISLALIFFLGIFSAYQLTFRVLDFYRKKNIAFNLANAEIEKIRNLPYESIGTIGGFPEGILEPSSSIVRNNIQFQIERRVDYVIDSTDGISFPEDECPNDYKRVKVKIAWSGKLPGTAEFSSDFSPENLVQECEKGGGILSVTVFDAFGQMVPFPFIEVKDSLTGQTIKTATPTEGMHYFSVPSGNYKLVVSKEGYSYQETFAVGEVYEEEMIVSPEKPNPNVLENKLTETSFSIDKTASFLVQTLSLFGINFFSDSFLDETKIAEKSNLVVSEGKVSLDFEQENQYYSSGYLFSNSIFPADLNEWQEFSFNDEEPDQTDIKYQIYYFSNDQWLLVPDEDLAGNSSGFDSSPVNLKTLSPNTYSRLKIKAIFSTQNLSFTPFLYDWQISWKSSQSVPIPNVTFNIRGEKIVGKDTQENPIFKYSKKITTDQEGKKNIDNLEWDNYFFSIISPPHLDLVSTEPSPQPISLNPDTNLSVKIYLDSQNYLLVTVQNQETLEPIFSAKVRIFKNNYDQIRYTNEAGQAIFIPLEVGDYYVEISAEGYNSFSGMINVFGHTVKSFKLLQIE